MDLISKQNAIEASTEFNLKSHMDLVEDELENYIDEEFIRLGEIIDDEILNSYFRIRNIIMSRSSAQRNGKWIKQNGWTCSICGYNLGYRMQTNFCPNCGVDMRLDNAPLPDDDSLYE